MSEFKREHRYWVFKRKHLSVREDDQMQSLAIQLGQEKCPDCVVVEEDWPECEIVWDLIKARAENRPSCIAELENEIRCLTKADIRSVSQRELELEQQLAALQTEVQEQARLLDMSATREARLEAALSQSMGDHVDTGRALKLARAQLAELREAAQAVVAERCEGIEKYEMPWQYTEAMDRMAALLQEPPHD